MESCETTMNGDKHSISDMPTSLSAIYVAGTFYQVGYQVGKKFRNEIDQYYKATTLSEDLIPFYQTPNGRQIYKEYLDITKEVYPQYVAEMEGIADGSGRPFHEVFLIHIEPEISTMLRIGQSTSAQCTTLMLNYVDNAGKQQTILAHNEDANVKMPKTIAYMVHARITADTNSSLLVEGWSAYCYPGHLVCNCFTLNSHGLAITTNRMFPDNVKRGKIPYYIAARALISCESIDAAEVMLRTDMHRVALGMSASLAFSHVDDSEQIIANIEIAPSDNNSAYGSKNYDIKRIPVANRKENGFDYHCNRYYRIQNVTETDGIEESSDHRKERIEALPVPSSIDDVLAMLGDTGNERFPIYRNGKQPDYLHTSATGVFDMMKATFSIYTNNPATGPGPVMSIAMPKKTVKKNL